MLPETEINKSVLFISVNDMETFYGALSQQVFNGQLNLSLVLLTTESKR